MNSGGVPRHSDDLQRDDVFFALLSKVERGNYKAMVGGIPCSTLSVARFKPDGAPVVRRHSKGQSRGLRGDAFERLPKANRLEAERANELAWRAAAIAQAAQKAGGVFIIENPVDRNGPIAEELGLRFVFRDARARVAVAAGGDARVAGQHGRRARPFSAVHP